MTTAAIRERLLEVMADALRSSPRICPVQVERRGPDRLLVTFDDDARFAITVALDVDDFEDCA
jgi:hypothetical protein